MTSEVARVLARIDLEIEAFRRLFHDPAQVASHAAIERRMHALGNCHNELRTLVPAQEAAQIFIAVMNTVADEAQSHREQPTEPAPEQPSIESESE